MSRGKALAKNTAIISIGTFLPKAVSFITLPLVTAGLTQTEYGTYDLIITLVSFFLPMLTLQIQAAAFRFLIDARNDEEATNRIVTNIFLFIVPVSLIALIGLFFVLYKIVLPIRLLICLYFFLDILVLSARQIVRGLANNMLYSISAVVESGLNMFLVLITIKIADTGIQGLMFSLAAATMAGLLLLIVKGGFVKRIKLSMVSKYTLSEMLRYSLPLVPTVLSDWILRLSDRMIITIFMGLEVTAVYAVANKIPAALTLVQTTFSYAWQENASMAAADVDADIYYSKMFDVVARVLSGTTALLIAVTPVLFMLLVKGNYNEAYSQMPILIMGTFFSVLSAFIGGIYVANKQTRRMAVTVMVAAIINLGIDLLLINQLGIYAASLSTLCSYIFLTLYRLYDVCRYHKIVYNGKKLLLYILFLLGMCTLCWFNKTVLNWINVLFAVLFACIINRKLATSILVKCKNHIQ